MAATNTAPVGGISVLVGLCTPAAALIPPTSGGSGGIPILQRRRNYPTPSYQLGTVFCVLCVKIFVKFLVVAVVLCFDLPVCVFCFSFSDWTPVELLPGQTTLGENNVKRKSGGI